MSTPEEQLDTGPNPVVALLPTFTRLLAIVAGDPALGARGIAIAAALNFTAQAIERGSVAQQAFVELTERVRMLADLDGAGDTQIWLDVKALVDAAEMVFQSGRN